MSQLKAGREIHCSSIETDKAKTNHVLQPLEVRLYFRQQTAVEIARDDRRD
jgi:hypothetical protein